jgi:hypothetical protein
MAILKRKELNPAKAAGNADACDSETFKRKAPVERQPKHIVLKLDRSTDRPLGIIFGKSERVLSVGCIHEGDSSNPGLPSQIMFGVLLLDRSGQLWRDTAPG